MDLEWFERVARDDLNDPWTADAPADEAGASSGVITSRLAEGGEQRTPKPRRRRNYRKEGDAAQLTLAA
jgi:hypothetical protein